MAAELYAVDQINNLPKYDGKSLRQLFGFGPAPIGRPLGAVSGVWPGTTEDIVTLTATGWSVAAHRGIIDKLAAADEGAYRYTLPTATGDITAADQTNPRKDRLDVQITQGDGETTIDSVAVVYTEGVAAATPVAPQPPDNSFLLGYINNEKAGGGNPTFTWAAPTAGGGHVQLVNKASTSFSNDGNYHKISSGWYSNQNSASGVAGIDTIGMASINNGQFVMPDGSDGMYTISTQLTMSFASAAAANSVGYKIYLNGSEFYGSVTASPSSSLIVASLPTIEVKLTGGDYLSPYVRCYGNSASLYDNAAGWVSFFRLERVG